MWRSRLIASALLLAGLGGVAFAGQLHTVYFAGPTVACGTATASATTTWVNATGAALYVREADVWMGVDMGGGGDVNYWLYDDNTHDVLNFDNDDHYKDRGAMDANKDHWVANGRDYYLISPGDLVKVYMGCAGPYPRKDPNGGNAPFHAAIVVFLRYLNAAP